MGMPPPTLVTIWDQPPLVDEKKMLLLMAVAPSKPDGCIWRCTPMFGYELLLMTMMVVIVSPLDGHRECQRGTTN